MGYFNRAQKFIGARSICSSTADPLPHNDRNRRVAGDGPHEPTGLQESDARMSGRCQNSPQLAITCFGGLAKKRGEMRRVWDRYIAEPPYRAHACLNASYRRFAGQSAKHELRPQVLPRGSTCRDGRLTTDSMLARAANWPVRFGNVHGVSDSAAPG
jgi:hypothetical protein